jgi:hypothetical protein
MQRYHREDYQFNRRNNDYDAADYPNEAAPAWAEATAPRKLLRHRTPSVLILELPDGDGDHWQIATLGETNAVADPGSHIGRLLRPHCALLALPYISEN